VIDVAQDRWVLVPGTLCTGAVFDPMLDRLGAPRPHRVVLTPDAPVITEYADRLRDTVRPGDIVCGFSLGALVLSRNLAALQGARAVVLLAANPFADPPENRAGREAVRDRVLAGEGAAWITETWSAMSTDRSDRVRAQVIAMADTTRTLIPAQTTLAASRPDATEDLRRSDLPVLFITGSKDRLTPPSLLRDIVPEMPCARLATLAGRGHFALLEDPDGMADAIRGGLAQLLSDQKGSRHGPHSDPSHAA